MGRGSPHIFVTERYEEVTLFSTMPEMLILEIRILMVMTHAMRNEIGRARKIACHGV
jgi:hypothetical protein